MTIIYTLLITYFTFEPASGRRIIATNLWLIAFHVRPSGVAMPCCHFNGVGCLTAPLVPMSLRVCTACRFSPISSNTIEICIHFGRAGIFYSLLCCMASMVALLHWRSAPRFRRRDCMDSAEFPVVVLDLSLSFVPFEPIPCIRRTLQWSRRLGLRSSGGSGPLLEW